MKLVTTHWTDSENEDYYYEWRPEAINDEHGNIVGFEEGGELLHVLPGYQSKTIATGTLDYCKGFVPEGLTMGETSVDIPEPSTDSVSGISNEADSPQ